MESGKPVGSVASLVLRPGERSLSSYHEHALENLTVQLLIMGLPLSIPNFQWLDSKHL